MTQLLLSALLLTLLVAQDVAHDPYDPMSLTCIKACQDFYQAKDSCLMRKDCYNQFGGEFNALVWGCLQPCLHISDPCEFTCISEYLSIMTKCRGKCGGNEHCSRICFLNEFELIKPRLEEY